MSQDQRQVIEKPVFERSPALITLQLTDENNLPIAKSQISTVTLTLYDKRKPSVFLNGRNADDIKDANGGTLSTEGLLTLLLDEDDQVLRSQEKPREDHVALIQWTWLGGAGPGIKEITFTVLNQVQLT